MFACLCVGTGGFAGAVLRYLAGNLICNEGFPLATLLINFFGSVLIGSVIGAAEQTSVNPYAVLFLKTGLCGGFTTFSTFSAEVLNLFETKQYLLGSSYAAGSVILCTAGVLLGKTIVTLLIKHTL